MEVTNFIKNKAIKEFINKTNAKIIWYREHPLLNDLNEKMRKNEIGGFYSPKVDIIFINPRLIGKGNNLIHAVFHELGHWTGHHTRLAREKMSVKKGTEEVVAESCFFYLAKHFKLDETWATKYTHKYIEHITTIWPKLNARIGYDNGWIAHKYLIELTNKTKKEENKNE